MKKVIDRKIYDTETAECVASWDNGIYGNDFRSCSEDLYHTKKGAWFLYGEGGPMSCYVEHHGNSTSGSEEIRALSARQALDWLEEKGLGEEASKLFPDDIEEA